MEIVLRDVAVRRGERWVLADLNVRLRAGERWALIGGNGAGKTQFLKLLAGDVWPTPTGGEELLYRLDGRRVDRATAKRRIAYLGAERQDKYARYDWDLPVRDLVATGVHGTDLLLQPITPAVRHRVDAMLRACGLLRLATRRFLSLSYGQKRLALLARALVARPLWLLLDEFHNGLDDRFRARVDGVLARARRRGQSWVVAVHRALDLPPGTTHFLELRDGRLVQTRQFEPADAQRLAQDAEETALPKVRAARTRTGGKVLVKLAKVDLYVDYRPVLRAVDWQLRAGEHWAVFGANGAGKSSFLKLLYGDLAPALGGRIERDGLPRGAPISAWKRQIGYVSPELQSDYSIEVSLVDLVASGRHASIGLVDALGALDRRRALHWLRFFDLLPLADLRPRELSYGQLRRALFARALANDPRLLLLDEPLTGLDPLQRAAMKRFLERLMGLGVSLVVAVHHAEDLPKGITAGLRLHKGRAQQIDLESAN